MPSPREGPDTQATMDRISRYGGADGLTVIARQA